MKTSETNQLAFSTLLFDTLFGLILFFNIDLFLDLKEILPFIFYIFSFFILVHWWLVFKSCDDAYDEEVTDSAADLVFGIIDIVLIDYVILLSRTFEYQKAAIFLVILLVADLVWALVWRYVGQWKTKNQEKIAGMEKELNRNILIDVVGIILFLALIVLGNVLGLLTAPWFVLLYIVSYLVYIYLTFKTKVIDINIF